MLAVLVALLLAQTPSLPASPAEVAIAQVVAARLGDSATVAVHVISAVVPAGPFAAATPDPLGRLGSEMNVTLLPAGPGARAVRVRARIDVLAVRVQARRPILRGHLVTADDVEVVTGPLIGVPVRRLPLITQIVGQPALRPIVAGQIIESSFVAVRHLVMAGDTVTVIAVVGAVQVTAECVAADSGDPGDIVRVVNRDTHRTLRVRVVNKGVVEVINGG